MQSSSISSFRKVANKKKKKHDRTTIDLLAVVRAVVVQSVLLVSLNNSHVVQVLLAAECLASF